MKSSVPGLHADQDSLPKGNFRPLLHYLIADAEAGIFQNGNVFFKQGVFKPRKSNTPYGFRKGEKRHISSIQGVLKKFCTLLKLRIQQRDFVFSVEDIDLQTALFYPGP